MLLTAVIGGAQSIVLLAVLGAGEETDAFLAAYSLYLPVALVANTFRGQLIPHFGSTEPEAAYRARAVTVSARAVALGALVCLVLAAAAPLSAPLVTEGLSHAAQGRARNVLLVLSVVAVLHFYAASLSALLAGSRRFVASSIIYVAAGTTGLVCSGIGSALAGPVGGAVGLLGGTVSLAAAHRAYLARFGVRLHVRLSLLRDRELLYLGTNVAGYAALTLAQQLNLSIALSAVSDATAGITLYTLAVYMVLTPLNLTSLTLSLVLLPNLVESLRQSGLEAAKDWIVRIAALSAAVVAPVIAGYYAVGLPIMNWLLGPLLEQEQIASLFGLGQVLFLLTVPLFMVNVCVAVAVALRRWKLTMGTGICSVLFQVAAVSALASHGERGVAAAQVVASALTACVLIGALFGGEAPALVSRAARAACPALLLAGVIPAARLAAGEDTALALVLCGAGLLLYVAGLAFLWPSVGRPLLRGVPFVRRLGQRNA
jgi:O-antigen/teichoic acid export membrane protein